MLDFHNKFMPHYNNWSSPSIPLNPPTTRCRFHKSCINSLKSYSNPLRSFFVVCSHNLIEIFIILVWLVLCLAIRLFNLIESQTWWIMLGSFTTQSMHGRKLPKLTLVENIFSSIRSHTSGCPYERPPLGPNL